MPVSYQQALKHSSPSILHEEYIALCGVVCGCGDGCSIEVALFSGDAVPVHLFNLQPGGSGGSGAAVCATAVSAVSRNYFYGTWYAFSGFACGGGDGGDGQRLGWA